MLSNTTKLINFLIAITVIISAAVNLSYSQSDSYKFFNSSRDIGEPKLSGSVKYDKTKKEYTLKGAGKNIWNTEDEFHFLSRRIKGDFIIRARLKFQGEGSHSHRKVGLMLREKLTSKSAHVSAALHGDGLTSLQYRPQKGSETEEKQASITAPDILQLERRGDTFIMSAAKSGAPFKTVQLDSLKLKEMASVGLFICSHTANTKETAVANNVRLIKPAPDGFTPYEDYIGSRIEIMNMETENRKIIHTSSKSIQAPNWTRDGKSLLYNSQGLMYRFNLKNSSIKKINTDFANNNNNDHVISFDGDKLGISHHAEEAKGESVIYTLPIEGGTPEKITPQAPSYLHGWSPDDNKLIYTGRRKGKYNIYKIPIKSNKNEIRLTNTEGLDDGSEYTPDGEYIYFNSNRTGTMQIWRMKPDGSEKEQVTTDKFNDWFPHISPDGKSIVFLSYRPEVESGDHPFYKHVYLRKIPISGGKPEVIAYLYGGQGTINVPSWSPDSRKIAFISNSKILK